MAFERLAGAFLLSAELLPLYVGWCAYFAAQGRASVVKVQPAWRVPWALVCVRDCGDGGLVTKRKEGSNVNYLLEFSAA